MGDPIDPQHSCWWTNRRRTDLRLDARQFSGAGVPARVLVRGLLPLYPHWGWLPSDRDDEERYWGFTSRPSGARREMDADEMVWLKQADLDALSVSMIRLDDRPTEAGSTACCEVFTHDDCFFSVSPATPAVVRAVLHAVLRQHGYYLGLRVDWDRHLAAVFQALTQTGVARLCSMPRRRELWLRADTRSILFLDAVLWRIRSRRFPVEPA